MTQLGRLMAEVERTVIEADAAAREREAAAACTPVDGMREEVVQALRDAWYDRDTMGVYKILDNAGIDRKGHLLEDLRMHFRGEAVDDFGNFELWLVGRAVNAAGVLLEEPKELFQLTEMTEQYFDQNREEILSYNPEVSRPVIMALVRQWIRHLYPVDVDVLPSRQRHLMENAAISLISRVGVQYRPSARMEA